LQCHKVVGEYEDDIIDVFLAKTMDVKKEMCEEITGNQMSITPYTYMTSVDGEIFQMCYCMHNHKCATA